tara:strand:+ start:610 stop:1092 length:483 start_codon:yes stop_codon:yes gene_type:complete
MTEHTKSFLPIVWSYVKQYNLTEDLFVKKKLKEGLKDTLKKMTDQKVAMVSEAVMIACNKINVDPFELLWTDRNVLGKDENGKSLLLWEHSTPLAEYFESLVNFKNEREFYEIVENYSGVCWLMRYEDNLLNKSKFRSSRPGGWKKAYESCNINVIVRNF